MSEMKNFMYKYILALPVVFLMYGCFGKVDSSEIVSIFDRHSYAKVNLNKLSDEFKKYGFKALNEFDDRAAYYPKSWLPAAPSSSSEKINAGLGLTLWKSGKTVTVVSVFKGSPAFTAGIRTGDKITHINEISVANMTNSQIQSAIYGTAGISCRLRGVAKNKANIRVTLKREFGGMPIVWGFTIPGTELGYVRIISFSNKSSNMLRSAMNDVLDMGAKKVILDLRGNRGGSLAELSTVLSYFAPGGGRLFSSMSRHKGYSMAFFSKKPGSYNGIPFTVLTDGDTISRAEIFASALREWGNTVIVGSRTGGNISATRGFTLKNGSIVRITVAKLFPPSSVDLDNTGVIPDTMVRTDTAVIGAAKEYPSSLANDDELLAAVIGQGL